MTGTSEGPRSNQGDQARAEADRSARKVLGAAKVAGFNGWAIGGCAALSLLSGLSSMALLPVGLGLAIVAWNELRGRKMLLRFEPRGPRLLGRNQLGLMALVVGYGLWSIYLGLTGTTQLTVLLEELEPVFGPTGHLQGSLTLALYGGVILLSLIFQGLNALYYFTRAEHVQACSGA
jgi:hypothetical protein